MTSSKNKTQYCTVRSWYMRKRIDHWCSVVPEKSQPSGPPFSGKLGKPRFPMERWALGLGFFCPHRTPMMDSIYLTLTLIMNSFSCSPLNTSFYILKTWKILSETPGYAEVRHADVILTLQLRHGSTCGQRVADVRLFVFLSFPRAVLVWVCEIYWKNRFSPT